MVYSVIQGVRISGFCSALPHTAHSYMRDGGDIPVAEAKKISRTIGVTERRVAPPHRCVSDYGFRAAESLIKSLSWDPQTIEILIFITQDPDYVIPATACVMQSRLGLPTSTLAYDINLGCSGFPYGLWTAATALTQSSAGRALVIMGDISTRKLKPGDQSTKPLFGDAAAVCALEKQADAPPMFGVFGTDGRGARHLIIPAGGSRYSLVPPEHPHSDEDQETLFNQARLHMNGVEVFGFSLRTVPNLIRDTLKAADWSLDDPDYYVWHQANAFMLQKIRQKLGIPEHKLVIDMEKTGNTSSSSIPLAICSQLAEAVSCGPIRLMVAGFGVGWSWGGMAIEIGPIPSPQIIEVQDDDPGLGSVLSD